MTDIIQNQAKEAPKSPLPKTGFIRRYSTRTYEEKKWFIYYTIWERVYNYLELPNNSPSFFCLS